MAIVIDLDVVMAQRKMGVKELAEKIDITMANLSILKNNKAKRSDLRLWTRCAGNCAVSREIF